MCATAKGVKVSYTSLHIICFKQCHPLWALVEPPWCHTGISSPGVECVGKSLCANSSLAAGHRRPVCQALICLACFIIHTECWMSLGGLWWIISRAVGDLQMTGQSVWCEQAHGGGGRERWVEASDTSVLDKCFTLKCWGEEMKNLFFVWTVLWFRRTYSWIEVYRDQT